MWSRKTTTCLVGAALSALLASPAAAVPTAAPGFMQLPSIPLDEEVAGGVEVVGGTIFVGQGSFGSEQSIVRIDPDGTKTTIASGFGSLAGLQYDSVNDRLIVGDNDVGTQGVGDTVFAVNDPFGSATVTPLAPGGTFAGVQSLQIDPSDPSGQTIFLGDSLATGLLQKVDVSDFSAFTDPMKMPIETVQTYPQFVGGLAEDGSTLFFGDARFDFVTFESFGFVLAVPLDDPTSGPIQIGPELPGQNDLVADEFGRVYSSSGDRLLLLDPNSIGPDGDKTLVVPTLVADGFGFATGIDLEGPLLYASDSGASELFVFVVPEPGSFGLAAGGLLALAGLARARRPRTAEG